MGEQRPWVLGSGEAQCKRNRAPGCLHLVERLVPLLAKCSSSLLSFSWQVQEEHQSLVYCAPNHVHQDPLDSLQASDQVGSTIGGRVTHILTLLGNNGAFCGV